MSYIGAVSKAPFGLALTSVVVEALRSVGNHAELVGLMEAVTREMLFRHYALIHHEDLRHRPPHLVDLKDYPPAIIERLIGEQRYRRGLCCKHSGPPSGTAPLLGSGRFVEMLLEHGHGLGHGRGANAK